MKREHVIRLIAGTIILTSLTLGQLVNPNWYWLTAFVGVNLIQSSLTKWCLMEDILNALGVGTTECPPATVKLKSQNS
jgi:hypothetical protein